MTGVMTQEQLRSFISGKPMTAFLKQPTAFVLTEQLKTKYTDKFGSIMEAMGVVDKAAYASHGETVAFQLKDGTPDIYFGTRNDSHVEVVDWHVNNPDANTMRALRMYGVDPTDAVFLTKKDPVLMVKAHGLKGKTLDHGNWTQTIAEDGWLVVNNPAGSIYSVGSDNTGDPLNYVRTPSAR